jgi:catechol 2,3-dioxygenase-like lactoylglutathione lyase family enzyme
MPAPGLRGLHHLKLPVTDLDASLAWYQRVFDAERQAQFDHLGDNGVRYAVVLALPGIEVLIELRWAPKAAAATIGYDPVNLAAGDLENLHQWIDHLDALQIDHSPIVPANAGHVIVFQSPDGLYLRLLTLPEGGIQSTEMNRDVPEPQSAWMAPEIMRHP